MLPNILPKYVTTVISNCSRKADKCSSWVNKPKMQKKKSDETFHFSCGSKQKDKKHAGRRTRRAARSISHRSGKIHIVSSTSQGHGCHIIFASPILERLGYGKEGNQTGSTRFGFAIPNHRAVKKSWDKATSDRLRRLRTKRNYIGL